MFVYFTGNIVEIKNSKQESREDIKKCGNSLQDKVIETNKQGELNLNVHDNEALALLLKIMAHDKKYRGKEGPKERGKTLYNFARTIAMLSHRTPKSKLNNIPKNFREKYYDINGRSIWRDIEFLKKMLIPSDQDVEYTNSHISNEMVIKILENDFPKLADIIVAELDETKPESEKEELRKLPQRQDFLPYTYAQANLHRELESLKIILDHTEPGILDPIDINTNKGKFALFRILEKVGEYASKKDLTDNTRNKLQDIDWDLLVRLRNRLAHHEHYLAHGDVLNKTLLTFDLSGIKTELEQLHTVLKTLQASLPKSDSDIREILQYYKPLLPEVYKLRYIFKHEMLVYCKNNLADEHYNLIKASINKPVAELLNTIINLRSNIEEAHSKNKLGTFIGKINEGHKKFINSQKSTAYKISKKMAQSFPKLRDFGNALPDDTEFKAKKIFDQLTILRRIRSIINLLNIELTNLGCESFNKRITSFSDERQFAEVPKILLSKIDIYKNNKSYKSAVDGLSAEQTFPLALPFRAIENVHDIASGRKILSDLTVPKLIAAIKDNEKRIIEDTIEYANFVEFSKYFLTPTFTFTLATDYLISSIFPLLNELPAGTVPGMPQILLKELKAHRNSAKHGNMYIDILAGNKRHEFLARYTSIFVKDLAPKMEEAIDSVYKNDWNDYLRQRQAIESESPSI